MTNTPMGILHDIAVKGTSLLVLATVIVALALPQTVQARVAMPLQDPVSTMFMDMSDMSPSYPVSGERQGVERTVTFTAYTSHYNQTDSTPFLPANGRDYRVDFERYGVVRGIASNDYPLGTRMKIPALAEMFPEIYSEHDIFEVTDRMNARYTGKNRMDLYLLLSDDEGNMDLDYSLARAREFGVRRLTIQIL